MTCIHYGTVPAFLPLHEASCCWFLLSCCGRWAQAMCLRGSSHSRIQRSFLSIQGQGWCCSVKTCQVSCAAIQAPAGPLLVYIAEAALMVIQRGLHCLTAALHHPKHGCMGRRTQQSAIHTWAGVVRAAGAGAAGGLRCNCGPAGTCDTDAASCCGLAPAAEAAAVPGCACRHHSGSVTLRNGSSMSHSASLLHLLRQVMYPPTDNQTCGTFPEA